MTDTAVSAEAPAFSTPSTPSASLIHARGLTKRFGDVTAVDAIDFDVAPGESFGFLGPNGAGKTSTMRMIGCVSPLSGGTLTILGLDPTRDGPRIRARLGVVPQQDSLDTELSVRENLLIYGRYFGLSRAEFFARLLVSEDGKEAVFVAPDEPLWNLPPDTASFGDRPLGTEPGLDDHSEQDLPQGLRTAGEDEEPVPAGPESVAAEEST